MANDNEKNRNSNVTGSNTKTSSKPSKTGSNDQSGQNEPSRNSGQDSGFASGSGRSGQSDIDRDNKMGSGKMGQTGTTGSRQDQDLDRNTGSSGRDTGNKSNR